MPDTAADVVRLRELIVALDKRHAQPTRTGEAAIARDSADMRVSAVRRLAELQSDGPTTSRDVGVSLRPVLHALLASPGVRPLHEAPMTAHMTVRPPPAPARPMSVPADETPEMTERWLAWQARGRVDRVRFRHRMTTALAGASLLALAALLLFALLAE